MKPLAFFQNLLFGRDIKCISCNTDVFEGEDFCRQCESQLQIITSKCEHCGMETEIDTAACSRCSNIEIFFDAARSYFVYDGAMKRAMSSYKQNSAKDVGERLAAYLVKLQEENAFEFDIVTFVPTSKMSMRLRGFDSAKFLAECFCQSLNLPLFKLLSSKDKKDEQKNLNLAQRKQNIRGKFEIGEDGIAGKKILLIDDVITTGATVNECARMLKKHKADKVFVLTVASTSTKLKMIN